jgi:hypothetical protein
MLECDTIKGQSYTRFVIFMTVKMWVMIFWIVTPRNLIGGSIHKTKLHDNQERWDPQIMSWSIQVCFQDL